MVFSLVKEGDGLKEKLVDLSRIYSYFPITDVLFLRELVLFHFADFSSFFLTKKLHRDQAKTKNINTQLP